MEFEGVPEDKTFACRECKFVFDPDATLGVLKAHMEVEHDIHSDNIDVDLVDRPGG